MIARCPNKLSCTKVMFTRKHHPTPTPLRRSLQARSDDERTHWLPSQTRFRFSLQLQWADVFGQLLARGRAAGGQQADSGWLAGGLRRPSWRQITSVNSSQTNESCYVVFQICWDDRLMACEGPKAEVMSQATPADSHHVRLSASSSWN